MANHQGYDSGHCWYYRLGGRIMTPEEICQEAEVSGKNWGDAGLIERLEKAGEPKRSALIAEAIQNCELNQAQDIQRYQEVTNQVEYERRWLGPYQWDEGRMWNDPCTAASLKHNHIFYNQATLIRLRSMTQQLRFF